MNDLMDVVPSAKFLKEFPSGKIPIRDTTRLESHLSSVEDLVVALKRMVRYHDETSALLKNLSAEQVFVEIEKYSLLPVHAHKERRDILRPLLAAGLSIRTLIRLIPNKNPNRVIGLLIGKRDAVISDRDAERVFRADELVMEGSPRDVIVNKTGSHSNTISALERLRPATDLGYEGAMKFAFYKIMEGETVVRAFHLAMINFPEVASSLTYTNIYALSRPSRLERNKKRFNYKETDDEN